MKMAVFDFALRKKGVYGVLHIIILLLSLFLVISISIDTFKNIPFYTQTSYKKIQLWICLFFLFDFVLEFFLSKDKLRYLRTHFIFLLVAIPYQNIIEYYHIITSPELSYFLRFVPLVCLLLDDVAGHGLFLKSYIFCLGAQGEPVGG